jgi:hypothetical protein
MLRQELISKRKAAEWFRVRVNTLLPEPELMIRQLPSRAHEKFLSAYGGCCMSNSG